MYVGTLIWNMDCLHFGPKSINCGLICKKLCRTYLQPVDKSFDPRQVGMPDGENPCYLSKIVLGGTPDSDVRCSQFLQRVALSLLKLLGRSSQ